MLDAMQICPCSKIDPREAETNIMNFRPPVRLNDRLRFWRRSANILKDVVQSHLPRRVSRLHSQVRSNGSFTIVHTKMALKRPYSFCFPFFIIHDALRSEVRLLRCSSQWPSSFQGAMGEAKPVMAPRVEHRPWS